MEKKKNNKAKKLGIEVIRHSLAHVMALALQRLYKKVQYGIGPETETGFYYDVLTKTPLTTEDLEKIEKEMRKIIKENLIFSKFELTILEGINLFKKSEQKFKLELIEDLKKYGTTNATEIEKLKELPKSKIKGAKTITVYTLGEKIKTKKDILKSKEIFVDLCKGPHIKSTGLIPESFKLTSLAGAYFRGSEKNQMLTRIYGLAFENISELNEYANFLEEAERRDHRKIGKELDLFSIDDYVGPGLVL
jgi:threonyl-tRNA synthetase